MLLLFNRCHGNLINILYKVCSSLSDAGILRVACKCLSAYQKKGVVTLRIDFAFVDENQNLYLLKRNFRIVFNGKKEAKQISDMTYALFKAIFLLNDVIAGSDN